MRKFGAFIIIGLIAIYFFVTQRLNETRDSAEALAKIASQDQKKPTHSSVQNSQTTTASKTTTDKASASQSQQILEESIGEDTFDIRVCENLSSPSKFVEDGKLKDPAKVNYQYTDREDPIAMAYSLPWRAIYREPEFNSYMHEYEKLVAGLTPEQREIKLKQWNGRARAEASARAMMKNKKYLERIADRSDHLVVLAKLVALKPAMAEHPLIMNFCSETERRIGQGDMKDIKQERQQVLALLKEAGVTPQEVHFYPDYYQSFYWKIENRSVLYRYKYTQHSDN